MGQGGGVEGEAVEAAQGDVGFADVEDEVEQVAADVGGGTGWSG